MAKIEINPVPSGFYTTFELNNRFQQIEEAFNDKVLWRDNPTGEPNQMSNLLDMADYRIINLPDGVEEHEPVTVGQVPELIAAQLPYLYNRTLRTPDLLRPLPAAPERINKLVAFDFEGQPVVVDPSADTVPDLALRVATLEEETIQSVATIADLEALDGVAVGQHFSVTGYLAGTLGGGDFVAIPGSDARDGVKTFVSANGVRIQRTNIEAVTPYHAGWNGTDDAHTYVQACLDHYNDVYCPAGTYTVLFHSVRIERSGVTLRGDGEETLFINKAGQEITEAGGVVKIAGTEMAPIYDSKIERIKVDYNRDNVTHTIDPRDNECISLQHAIRCETTHCVTVNGIYEGIDLDYADGCLIARNVCHYHNGHGIHVSSGSQRNLIFSNTCHDNGWVAFRSGMDCYEGFDLGGPGEIPASSDNIYIGNDCYDNYINYRILGPGNVFDANKDHGTTGVGSNLSGVIGGVRAITASAGERAKNIWQANTGNDELASFAEVINPDGNARFKLCYRKSTAGVESFIIASNTDNVLFEIFAGSGFATFAAQWTPASGAFGSITYQNATGYYVRTGKQVIFNLRLSMSALSLGTASGKIQITGLPVLPQVATPCVISSVYNWDFGSIPTAIKGRVTETGAIEFESMTPNATSQTFISAADLKTGSGSFLNNIYVSGSFVTA